MRCGERLSQFAMFTLKISASSRLCWPALVPVGVYEADDYGFPAEQRKFLKTRLAAGRPTFGICLGAQQIAASLGANVAPRGRERDRLLTAEPDGGGADEPA